MTTKEDLNKIVILRHLTDDMLDKLLPHIDSKLFNEKDIIFREGDIASHFYMLKRGKVLLENRMSEKITVLIGAVKAGFSFGWSAMLDGGAYTSDAVCAETCEVLSVQREKMLTLMNEDHSLGFIFTQGLMRIIKKRLDRRTEQFLKAIQDHPEIKELF